MTESANQNQVSQVRTTPKIGVLMEIDPPKVNPDGTYNYAGHIRSVSQNTENAVEIAGGKPITVDYDREDIPNIVAKLDGLLTPGDVFDVADHTKLTKSAKKRLTFEMELITAMFAAGKPVFAICAGYQAIGKLLGGKMIEDIPTEIGTVIKHNHKDYQGVGHVINIVPGGFMAEAANNQKTMGTNAIHHQGFRVSDLPKEFTLEAFTDDGVVEAVSLKDSQGKTIFQGVQFHAEIRHDTGVQTPNTTFEASDFFGGNLIKNFVDLAREVPQPEHTTKLVSRIKELGILEEVLKAPTIPDYQAASAVMPSAGKINEAIKDAKKFTDGIEPKNFKPSDIQMKEATNPDVILAKAAMEKNNSCGCRK